MSPNMNIEIVRQRQQEVAARAARAHLFQDPTPSAARSRRSIRSRVVGAAAALAACLAVGTALTAGGAHAKTSSPARIHVSAAALNRELRGLEAEGYVPWQCTTSGTRMFKSGTDRFVDVIW